MDGGESLGVMETYLAKAKAKELGLDLVEVSPEARPPVCKIIDFGRYKYDLTKKKKEAKKNQTKIELKEIKLSPRTDVHDMDFKIRNARKFIEEGNKCQLVCRFRGRENAHPETGKRMLDKFLTELADIIKIESMPKLMNKTMTMIIAPK